MTDDLFPYLFERFTLSSPVDLTYIGIGSCPHVQTLEEYTPSWQQIFPPFLQEMYQQHPSRKFRMIHFDPYFEQRKPLLEAYVQSLDRGLLVSEKPIGEPEEVWSIYNDYLEIILVSTKFEHPCHDWFIEGYVDFSLQRPLNEKVVIQEFTGYSLSPLRKSLYLGTSNKPKFLSHILLDFTYGLEEGCYQDLTKYAPLYKESGDFLNILLESDESLLRQMGRSPLVDTLIRQRYYVSYVSALNTIHVDYRRAILGHPYQESSDYSDNATPDEIMNVLKYKLRALYPILQRVNLMKVEDVNQLEWLLDSNTYTTMDMYKWNTNVRDLVKFDLRGFNQLTQT